MSREDSSYHFGSLVHHGPLSDRACLAILSAEDVPGVVVHPDARERDYGTIIAQEHPTAPIAEAEYVPGAVVSRIYPVQEGSGRETGLFLARSTDHAGSREIDAESLERVLRLTALKTLQGVPPAPPDGWHMQRLTEADAEEMALLFDNIFKTSSFPINNRVYFRRDTSRRVCCFSTRPDEWLTPPTYTNISGSPESMNVWHKLLQ